MRTISRSAPLAAVIAATLCAAVPAGAAIPDLPDPSAPVAEGRVYTLARHGSTAYLGGEFEYVGPRTGSALLANQATGTHLEFPEVAGGPVYAVEPDGAGGFYLGGTFTHVGGVPRSLLAHVLADGSVDPAFDVAIPSGTVYDLQLAPGGKLFAGGSFGEVNGVDRDRLAQLDAATGALSPWNPDPNNTVRALELSDNAAKLYVGGAFNGMNSIAGVNRDRLAEFDVGTGAIDASWTPGADGEVRALTFGNGSVYVGGFFDTLGGQTRNHVGRVTLGLGSALAFDPDANDAVLDIVLDPNDSNVAYIGGRFDGPSSVGASQREHLASVNAGTGAVLPWNPGTDGSLWNDGSEAVDELMATDSAIFVGGSFTQVGGQPRNGAAAVDAAGAVTSFDPNVGNYVYDMASAGSNVLLGGEFVSAGGALRRNLAAIDASGALTGWNPGTDISADVRALAVAPDGATVYAGGNFDELGGQPRDRLGAVDAAGGAATGFSADVNGTVRALLASADGSAVYVAGDFTTIGPDNRSHLAALDPVSGAATGWNPDPDSDIHALALAPGGPLYLGGNFSNIGATPRDYLAAVDTASGAPTGWDPGGDNVVRALALSKDGSLVYAGGHFSNTGGSPRDHLAALSAATGAATAFDPSPSNHVYALATSVDGSTLYVGGGFHGTASIGGVQRDYLAALDAAGGVASWSPPAPDSDVYALLAAGTTLHAGGEFSRLGAGAVAGLASFSEPQAAGGSPPALADGLAPLITRLSMTNRSFAATRSSTPVSAQSRRRARRVRRGTTFRYSLSEPARAVFTIQRRSNGLRVGRRCRRATARLTRTVRRQLSRRVSRRLSPGARKRRIERLLRRRRCALFTRRGALTRNAGAGANTLRFSGRIGRRALGVGSYRALLVATDAAGNASRARSITFRVVRAPSRR